MKKNAPINIVCIKHEKSTNPAAVNRLYSMILANISKPFNFYCITNDQSGLRSEIICRHIPTIRLPKKYGTEWVKMSLFHQNMSKISGRTLYLDLNVVITGLLDDLFEIESSKFMHLNNCFLYNPSEPIYFEMFRVFEQKSAEICQKFTNPMNYIDMYLGNKLKSSPMPDGLIINFVSDCKRNFPLNLFLKPRQPRDAKIIYFSHHEIDKQANKINWIKKFYKK